ncbi:hypothetical protein [Saccharibacillus kuerlensis]|uniref:Uncharacterized protein n=1 Tax=Saccharibacillus kuerlensis TaxID=459527 RepID=A0ABQ2L0J4_9BACL|nr:hypothetical protein [Saccharibacillus kuerlensis]GGN98756.1 hypothetical protein GCM10010969_18200 [Saccharibacillus kuerlensis]
MTKMKSLSALALTLMLTGVLAACGNDQAASPAANDAQTNAEQSIEEIPAAEDNDAHPTSEVDIEIDEEAAAEGSDASTATESTDLNTMTGDPDPADNGSGSTDSSAANSGSTNNTSTGSTNSGETAGSTGTTDSPAAAAEQTGEGTYSGLADNHTAEIEVNGQPVSYQLSEEAQAQIGKIPTDADVSFTYTEEKFDAETTVMTITDIKAAE